jgi:hypothetical protein
MVQDITSVRMDSVHSEVRDDACWDWANFYATIKPEEQKDYPKTPPVARSSICTAGSLHMTRRKPQRDEAEQANVKSEKGGA